MRRPHGGIQNPSFASSSGLPPRCVSSCPSTCGPGAAITTALSSSHNCRWPGLGGGAFSRVVRKGLYGLCLCLRGKKWVLCPLPAAREAVKGVPGKMQARMNMRVTHVQGTHTARTIPSHPCGSGIVRPNKTEISP